MIISFSIYILLCINSSSEILSHFCHVLKRFGHEKLPNVVLSDVTIYKIMLTFFHYNLPSRNNLILFVYMNYIMRYVILIILINEIYIRSVLGDQFETCDKQSKLMYLAKHDQQQVSVL